MNEKIKGLNGIIEDAIKNDFFPGANYCLIANGEVFYGSFGKKALYPKAEENDLDTLYDMASCSKVISTTTSIMILIEQGKIRLYDPVCTYLPNFMHKHVTIFDLLTHTSGLPADVRRANKLASKEEALEKIFGAELTYDKNTKIVYSDIGFILLGLLVESVSGKTLDNFAKEYIFNPLEMTSTTYNPTDFLRCAPTEERNDEVVKGMLRGKVHDEKAYILGGVAGHAGVFSCVKDVKNFLEMLLNDGEFKGKRILSKAVVDMLFVPQVRVQNGISMDYDQRGLGWIVKGSYSSAGDLASPNTILHTGFTGTNVFVDRDNKVAFSLLTNRVHPTRNNTKIISFRGKLGNYIISHFGIGGKDGI